MKIILSEKAPKVVGPYSQAIETGGLVFCSGQIGIDPQTSTLREGVEAQTHQIMKNISAVLSQNGLSLNHIVKTTIFLGSMQDYQKVNGIYGEYFTEHKPARSTIQVAGLPIGALIEIEFIAERKID